ncbi:MAG: NFACT family protein, partial [archaeon]
MKPIDFPGITIHFGLEEWNKKWAGGFIQQLRGVEENRFVLKVRAQGEVGTWLIVLPLGMIECEKKYTSLEEQPGIVKSSKVVLENQRIEKMTQAGMDRIVKVECEKVDIILEFFGSGNIIITDKRGEILHALESKEWKTRTIRRGNTYAPPPGPSKWN